MDTKEELEQLSTPDIDSSEVDVNKEDDDSPLSQKETVVESLQTRNLSPDKPDTNITLEFGDIIEIIAPTNPEIHEMSALITYIDNEKIRMVDVTNYQHYKINITEEGTLSDESIIQINLLSRSEEKGYARQNNLLPRTWIDIHFGGEIPAIITGQISNLEEDMIEITTFPELKTIYVNFAYKGIPENIPIEKIMIRNQPAIVKVPTLSMLKANLEDGEMYDPENDLATIEYTESGETMITIPKGAQAEKNIRDELHEMYMESTGIIFGEKLGEITQLVEIPEGNQRFGIDIQVNDLMDELLSTIPNSQRNKLVLDNIHLLIERYKQLRAMYSKFDKNDNVYDIKELGAAHKPLIEHIEKMDKKLQWIVPVVTNRRKLYDIDISIENPEIIIEKSGNSLRTIESKQQEYYKNNSKDPSVQYDSMHDRIQKTLTPFEPPLHKETYLHTTNVLAGIDSIVDNLEEFYSTVYNNNNISRRQYVIQRYTLGYSKLEEQVLKNGKNIFLRKPMTSNDQMTMKSLITLPESVIRFSSIELPSTSILDKATLHQNYFMLFRLLKKNLDIVPHVINDLSKELNYELMEKDTKTAFFSGIHEFILNNDDVNVDDEDKMNKFLDVIIPKTRFLIRLIRKYLKDKLSFVDVVKQLEPFMVYASDISYKQYMEVRYIIKERIAEVRTEIEKRSFEFAALRNAKYNVDEKPNPILRLLTEKKDFTDEFFKAYQLKNINDNNTDVNISSSEILKNIIHSDNGTLYNNTITSILISLMTPNQLLDILAEPNLDDMSEAEKIKPADCGRKYLAKRYSSIRDMQKDNEEDEIYFDTDLDDTPYDIIKRYKKEKSSMIPELFVEFLERTLIDKHDCPRAMAPELAKTLITGKKLVADSDYAVLEIRPELPKDVDKDKLTEKEKKAIAIESDARIKFQYYRRLKNIWIKDKDIDEQAFLDTNTIFCNITSKCYKNTTNSVCEPVDDAYERMKTIAKKKMIGEFDNRYNVNVEELEKQLEEGIHHSLKMLKKTQGLDEIKLFKASRLAFALGNMANINDVIISPHMKLRDLVLGQDDFVKKQYDICRFTESYCRTPMVDNLDEDQNWLYCKDTNTKLFPISIHTLAKTFISGGDYLRKLDELCHTVGVLSDDGDADVDKHSGFVLRKKTFSTEEGFDTSGYQITTNDIIEKDLGEVVMEQNKKKEKRIFENETAEVIFNVANTICRNIDIPINSIEDLIMTMSRELFDKAIFSETAYQKRSDKNLKSKGKPLQPYKNYRDETRVVIITCCLFVAIQTAVPSFKTNKTMPGCIRSFSGYPLEGGVEDMSGLQYLACVLDKSKNKDVDPWSAIDKLKPDVLAKRMKDIFDNYIMNRGDVIDLYVKKREFMILSPELVVPEELKISKWTHYLPPVVDFSVVKSIQNVASDFESMFKDDMQKGSKHNYIGVIKGKMTQYGYGVIECINNIVKTKDLVLKNSANIPFVENACCNDKLSLMTPLSYFNNDNDKIAQFIVSTTKLASLAKFARDAATPAFLYHPTFSGIRYASLSENNLDDVELIYSAIIHYCNFDKGRPIPEKFKTICNEKPAKYNYYWTIHEKIEHLKSNANNFKIEHLQQLITIVNNDNLVIIDKPTSITKITIMKELLEHLDSKHSTIIDEPLRRFLLKIFDQYKPKCMSYDITNELNDLKNYLITTNRDLYKQIIQFFGTYGNLSDSQYEKLHLFLTNMSRWKSDIPMKESGLYYDEGLYSVTQFINNSIQNICKVYPSVLLNDGGFYKKVPKHWGLSDTHRDIISKFIEQYYNKLEKFKGDTVLLRLLQEIDTRLTDLPIFLQNLPFFTEIVKDMGDDVEGERVRSFYCLFDKPTIYLLYTYCFYSAIYEYIVCANDVDLLRADVQKIKQTYRKDICEQSNPANLLIGGGRVPDDLIDIDNTFNEMEIITGDINELKKRVADLLLCFLNVEEENKDVINLSYKEIMQKVKRDKDIEKQGIIERLGKMSIEERSVENDLKNYRIGRWNVGEQKGLYQYDKNTFDREIGEMLTQGEQLEFENTIEMIDADDLIVDPEGEDSDNIYDRGAIDLGNLGDNFMDGAYYEEDIEYDEDGDF
jgi:hypothetical protein